MTRDSVLNLGIVGACGRGASFRAACDALKHTVRVHAVCDTNSEGLAAAAERLGAAEKYTDFATMLEKSALDAVIIGTPMQWHVPQAVAALERHVSVLSEVPAGVSVEECRDLVRASRKSRGVYMMAENYTYIKSNAIVRELVRQGLFGTPFYAEGEYIHELKGLNEQTVWRRKWQTGTAGVTYGTHSLGPIMQWMPGDRVVRVCCAGSGHHYIDPRGNHYENDDSTVMLCQMRSGALVKIRVDMLSDRPHAMTNYQLQGTDGCYESARARGEKNRVWLRARNPKPDAWLDLAELEAEYTPQMWREAADAAQRAGHGGGDYFEVLDFVDAILGKRPAEIGIHEALDMTLPGLVSQASIQQDGAWLPVPDSRTWTDDAAKPPQLQMLWPEAKLTTPPEPRVPAGYRLRQFADSDMAAYIALLAKAGFEGWTEERVRRTGANVLPDGFFVIEHLASGALVATALALHRPLPQHPFGGELGWVAADPAHCGKGLGKAVCAAATKRLVAAGYRRIYLLSDDHRIPALSIYLNLGWEPLLTDASTAARWQAAHRALDTKRA